jgi:hypothetical protein
MLERKSQKMVITLENINQSDAIALTKMFKYMEYLGKVGSSRMCSFFADGDGAFRPKVNIEYPESLPDVKEVSGIDKEGNFKIDSDAIAWKIYH